MTKRKPANAAAKLYLAAVRHELADVPWRRRDDLLATVTERLEEIPGDAVPSRELGPSREYARELRESAGLPPQRLTPVSLFRATRGRTKIAAIASVLVIAAMVGALTARAHYQPVSVNAFLASGTAQSITDNLVTDVDYVRYQPGKLIVRGMQVQNHGWATVTVDGFAVGNTPAIVSLREMRATTNELITGVWTSVPKVASVTIRPGKTVYLFEVLKILRFQLGAGGGISFSQPKLRIHVLGVTHLVTVQANRIGLLAR